MLIDRNKKAAVNPFVVFVGAVLIAGAGVGAWYQTRNEPASFGIVARAQAAPKPAPESAPAATAKTAPEAAPAAEAGAIKILGSQAAIEEAEKFKFSPEHPYLVIEGLVNKPTFWGYMRYGMYCFHCHGPDGLGSSYAPSLVQSLNSMPYEDFVQTVMNGRKNISTSSNNVMPDFGADPNVVNFIDNIYAYLKGRSDGKIPQGRPDYLGEKTIN